MELQWELMIFTLFVCLGAGVFAALGVLTIKGKGKAIQTPALILSLGAIVVGGIGSFLHLQHWERVFNGFGHLSSGITQELIGIVVFVLATLLYFVLVKRAEEGTPPKWAPIMAIVISAALVAVMAHTYNMASRPIWDTVLLWLYYLCNAALLGGFAIACLSGWKDKDSASTSEKLMLCGSIANLFATLVYWIYFAVTVGSAFTNVGYYFDPTHPTKTIIDPSAVFMGEAAIVFWVGAVLVGAIAPLVFALLTKRQSTQRIVLWSGAGVLCALVGGMCFRVVLYLLGFSVFSFY